MPASSTMKASRSVGIGRIERDVARADFERGQHADDHLDAAFGGDPDPVARADCRPR